MNNSQLEYYEIVPEAYEAMQSLETSIGQSGLDESLFELVKLRASQLNGCAFCVDLHTKRAKGVGEHERRIAAVAAWRESPFFEERERVALDLTERLTRLADGSLPNEVYQAAAEQFTDEELVDLVLAIVAINGWNRLWVSFQTPEIPELSSWRSTPEPE